MTVNTPRVALVGVSGYAREHLNFLLLAQRQRQLTLCAAVAIAPEKEREQRAMLAESGCRVYGSVEALWAEHQGRIDLAVIPTPIHLHEQMTLAALSAGANVLVEKPLTSDPAAVARLESAEARAGSFVAVGFQDLYAEGLHRLKRLLLNGALGQIRSMKVCGLWPRNDDYYRRNEWAGRLYVGEAPVFDSPLNNALAHHLNVMLFLAGARFEDPGVVEHVEAELFRSREIASFDTAAVRLVARGGVELIMFASHSSQQEWTPEVAVEGDDGRATWNIHSGLKVVDGSDNAIGSWPGRDLHGAMAEMYDHVLARLHSEKAYICPIRTAAAHVHCIAEIHRSTEIVDIPAAEKVRATLAGGPHTIIRGLEKYFQRAFAEGQLLHEVGCPWAQLPRSGRIQSA